MISVSLWRSTLEKEIACADGLALFDQIAALQRQDDPRRTRRIRVGKWTPLHTAWLHSSSPSFASWLEQRGLIPRANLTGANLTGADISRANLTGADISRANLTGANLTGADISRANLTGADISRANLSRANLYGADLSRANLSRANLTGADLSRANLSRANLSRANLYGAYRGASDKIPGWHTLASGYLEKETS